MRQQSNPVGSTVNCAWMPPLHGIYKINRSVQFILELDRNGLGVLTRGAVGAVMAFRCSKIS